MKPDTQMGPLNSLKQLESFKKFESEYYNTLVLLNNTLWTYFKNSDSLSVYNDLLNKGYEEDAKLQEQVQKNKLKNPQLRSAQQRAEGLS